MSEWVKSFSRVRLFATAWTVAYQAPPSMGFSRQEYWSGLPFPSPGDLPNPGIKPRSPALQGDALTSEPPGKPNSHWGKEPSTKKILSAHRPGKSKRYTTEDIAESKAFSYVIWMSNSHLKPNISKPELLFSLQNLAPHVNSACQ